ncbi:MAG: hypothetical protein ACPGSD_16275 [Flavobacteriales bacterium]
MRLNHIFIAIGIFSFSALGALRSCGRIAKSADKAHDLSRLRKLKSVKPAFSTEKTAKAISNVNHLNNIINLINESENGNQNHLDSTLAKLKSFNITHTTPIKVKDIKIIGDLACHIPVDYKSRYYFNRKKVLMYWKAPKAIRVCTVRLKSRDYMNRWFKNQYGIHYKLRGFTNKNNELRISFYLQSPKKNIYQIYFQEDGVDAKDEMQRFKDLVLMIHQIRPNNEQFK